jgi:hypothetical protein
MFSAQTSTRQEKPALTTLISVSLCSILLMLLVMYLIVLPRFYGIDPTGVGAKLGITQVAATPNQQADVKTEVSGGMPESRQDVLTLTLAPKQSQAFKIAMERDYELNFHWATDGKPLLADLRGHKHGAKASEFKVFGKLKESRGKGFFIAPFTGEFELTWENKADQPVTVRLNAKGFYQVLS